MSMLASLSPEWQSSTKLIEHDLLYALRPYSYLTQKYHRSTGLKKLLEFIRVIMIHDVLRLSRENYVKLSKFVIQSSTRVIHVFLHKE